MAKEFYKEPVRVICIIANNSSKLIEGCEYLATGLYGKIGDFSRHVQIKDVGSYKAELFALSNGTPLEMVQEFSIKNYERVTPSSKDYTGQYIKCTYSSGKYIKEGEIYYVEQQIKIGSTSYYNPDYNYYFKLKNIKNKVSTYNFQEIPLAEQRNIKLKNIDGNAIKTGDMTRKFLLYKEQEKINILFNLLSKSLNDVNKIQNKTDTKELIIKMMLKKGRCYAIIKEDIESFLNNNINNLINML